MYYRKKPVVVRAFQLEACEFKALPGWIRQHSRLRYTENDQNMVTEIYIDTLEGSMCAEIGDWIIQGIKGELYPCKPDIFAATYEKVDVADGEAANASETKE